MAEASSLASSLRGLLRKNDKISTTTNSMNYFVNDGEVNIILGTDSGFAEPTYTLELVDGDEIEQHSSVTYTRL